MNSNIALVLSLFIFCLCFQTACKMEEPIPTDILSVELKSSADSNPYLGRVGEAVSFTFTAAIPDLFDKFIIVERKNNVEAIIFEASRLLDPSFADDDFFEHEFEYELSELGVEVTILCILTDQAGNDITREWRLEAQ